MARFLDEFIDLWGLDPEFDPVGATPDALEQLEARYDVTLPLTFRDYLLRAAPQEEFWDSTGVTWWGVQRVKNIPEEYRHGSSHFDVCTNAARYLFFADYAIWCWAWAICCDPADQNYGRIVAVGGQDRFVADDFETFLKFTTADVDELAPLPPNP